MDITDRALLVSLKISVWTGEKRDKTTTREVCRMKDADSQAIRVNKNLLGETIKPVAAAAGAIRATLNKFTLPWHDEGTRIVKGSSFEAMCSALIAPIQEFDKEVEKFLETYQTATEQHRRRMGQAYEDSDYPPVHVVRRRFGVRTHYHPIPTENDFRVSLADEEMDMVRRSSREAVEETVRDAVESMMRRMRDPVARMAERLRLMKTEDGKVQHPFRDTLVGNIREIVSLTPVLNLTDDPRIKAIADEMSFFLAEHEPDELRADETLRLEVATRADAILAQMDGAFP